MIREEEVFKIGVLGKPHGVKGEINFLFTDDVWDRVESDYLICRIDGILVPFFLEEYRFRGEQSALLKFQDIDTSEDVKEMSGLEVFFPYSLMPDEEPDDYTWSYFTGFSLIDKNAGVLGNIARVDDTTMNVLFEMEDGKLIPAVEEFIDNIDHSKREIYTNLPQGLIEL